MAKDAGAKKASRDGAAAEHHAAKILLQVLQYLQYKLQAAEPAKHQCAMCNSVQPAMVQCSTCTLAGRWLCVGCDAQQHGEAHCHERAYLDDGVRRPLLPSQVLQVVKPAGQQDAAGELQVIGKSSVIKGTSSATCMHLTCLLVLQTC